MKCALGSHGSSSLTVVLYLTQNLSSRSHAHGRYNEVAALALSSPTVGHPNDCRYPR
jgi:hypothetical protein